MRFEETVMMTRVVRWGRPFTVATLVVALAGAAGCSGLQARRSFKAANAKVQVKQFRDAIPLYEEVLTIVDAERLAADDSLSTVWFFLGYSYDNLYKPAREDDPQNQQYAQKAIENYKIAAERSKDPKFRALALQYLFAMYGADKLDRPAEAEQIGKRLIELNPNEVGNYFALARHFHQVGNTAAAEAILKQAAEVAPNDPNVYNELATHYNKEGDFEKTIAAYEQVTKISPNDPQAQLRIAQYFQEKAQKDFRLNDRQKQDFVNRGLVAADKALGLKGDYMEAMVYKNILLRQKAGWVKNRAEYDAIIKEADQIRDRAMELQKRQQGKA
jgi:tetratricopeptide (TPR) repeat protein